MSWISPLPNSELRLPLGTGNPKGFGALNEQAGKHNLGIDFETEPDQIVQSIERGLVIGIEDWNTKSKTKAILIRGASGVICYGNIKLNKDLDIGTQVDKRQHIGFTSLKKKKNGTKTAKAFLRIEWYTRKTKKRPKWYMDEPAPRNVINPTQQFVTNIVSTTTVIRRSPKLTITNETKQKRGRSTSLKQRTSSKKQSKNTYYHAPISSYHSPL